ncbi:MAG TPA: hypothetical protein VN654_06900 [Vicinamibacterales bacterium]|nr:hypothetical protein [Vicinamibacterales bacterium]
MPGTSERVTAAPEEQRLDEDARRSKNWKRWGPYLSERQWATVREDYSADNNYWESFPYEHSLARAYRWGEDGLLGITDRECRLCFALALWNGKDPHLKERLFGLTNPEGNHSEDVKEVYFYLDATPTYSYFKALYKYPQAEFPYEALRAENRRRGRAEPEYELTDTGVFDDDRYWDITARYAKASPDDILIRLTVANRGSGLARLHLLPTLWFRNTWSWGAAYDEGRWAKPRLTPAGDRSVVADHETLGRFRLTAGDHPDGRRPVFLFTENENNAQRLFNSPNESPYVKDAFHHFIVDGRTDLVRQDGGTKAAVVYVLDLPATAECSIDLRLTRDDEAPASPFADFERVFAARKAEADAFYAAKIPQHLPALEQAVSRQAYAGLLWSQQFYQYIVPDWINGDAKLPLPPAVREARINRDWPHLFSRDVLSVPDKWEYPAFFAWDLAFHMIPMARIDPDAAKKQLLLLLREWYLHPNGQLPAFEYDLSSVNPPVHAWACWQVFVETGRTDHAFLERAFHKLLMNFTWWVNRTDPEGRNVFSGGFLGMDNIGVFDRSRPLPTGGRLQQADGTAWMGFYCTSMLRIALELALHHDRAYEDVASKFLEHFIFISDSLNNLGGRGLWDEEDGFYYDQLLVDGRSTPLKLRALIGLIPLLAVHVLVEDGTKQGLPEFAKRADWFLANRKILIKSLAEIEIEGVEPHRRWLLSLPGRNRLERALRYLLDEREFLSPHGVRSLSRVYKDRPYVFRADGDREYEVAYVPGDMDSRQFGGNSNWRGPVWFPINFLLIEALRDYHRYYGDTFRIECPTGSGRLTNLNGVAQELAERLASLFVPEAGRPRPCHGSLAKYADDPHWRDYILFYEYFDGDTGRGLGASHQTGWTALVASLLAYCRPISGVRAGTAAERVPEAT